MKGFVGPIGDDLPSILAILLALSVFFSGLTFALTTYNERLDNFNKLKGTIDIGRKVTSSGRITSSAGDLRNNAEKIAQSYGLDFCIDFASVTACYPNSIGSCKDDWVRLKYLVASGGGDLTDLEVCAG